MFLTVACVEWCCELLYESYEFGISERLCFRFRVYVFSFFDLDTNVWSLLTWIQSLMQIEGILWALYYFTHSFRLCIFILRIFSTLRVCFLSILENYKWKHYYLQFIKATVNETKQHRRRPLFGRNNF